MKQLTLILGTGAIFLLLSVFSLSCDAQRITGNGNIQSQMRETGSFHKIDCSGTFHVFLTQGNSTQVKVETDENLLPYVITEVNGNTLDLKIKKEVSPNPSKSINVYVTLPELDALNVSGVCKVQSQNILQSDHLKINVSGTADMDLKLSTGSLTTSISGTAKMNLQGKASSSKLSISGSGNVTADDLATDNTEAHISGMGKLHVNAQKELTVSVSGMGKVWYKGNPAVNESISGMGKIIKE
ncbi:MAG: DUF2807 domain-containing protein [Chitinophagaceae bacterium]|nr:MAG: DUF2807 domain-containing protein [Chitinophagaceae bacterium]